jgi:hypothetical protein
MVRLIKETNPFDGISDGVIKGAVLTCCAAPSSGSRGLHISPAWLITMASAGCSQPYRKEHFD